MSWLLVAGLTVRQPTWPGQGCWQWAGGTLERPLELLCDSLDGGWKDLIQEENNEMFDV